MTDVDDSTTPQLKPLLLDVSIRHVAENVPLRLYEYLSPDLIRNGTLTPVAVKFVVTVVILKLRYLVL
jgi:hypothetical protein